MKLRKAHEYVNPLYFFVFSSYIKGFRYFNSWPPLEVTLFVRALLPLAHLNSLDESKVLYVEPLVVFVCMSRFARIQGWVVTIHLKHKNIVFMVES